MAEAALLNSEILKTQVGTSIVKDAINMNSPETGGSPDWFKRTVKKVSDAWFDPKSFEKDPRVYEKLGVRSFKKWMPTSGDMVRRLVWKRFGADEDFVKPNSTESLKNYEKFTRLYEGIHLAFLALGVAQLTQYLHDGQIGAAVFTTGINTLINIYPILLQRYNRTRLFRAINKLEARVDTLK